MMWAPGCPEQPRQDDEVRPAPCNGGLAWQKCPLAPHKCGLAPRQRTLIRHPSRLILRESAPRACKRGRRPTNRWFRAGCRGHGFAWRRSLDQRAIQDIPSWPSKAMALPTPPTSPSVGRYQTAASQCVILPQRFSTPGNPKARVFERAISRKALFFLHSSL
jgi:hypothetical protein